MSTTVKILKKARALVKQGWCQGFPAIDANGDPINEQSNKAVKFCALGALWRAQGHVGKLNNARRRLDSLVKGYLGDWNDRKSRKKSDVVHLYTRAIAIESMSWRAR